MTTDQIVRRELAGWALERLTSSLDEVLGDRLQQAPGRGGDPYRDGVVVTPFSLVERCARRAANPADDFASTSATVRRRVGLAALRRLADDGSDAHDLAAAVDEVLSDRGELSRSLGDWLEDLEPAGRAAVAAAAITWAASVCRVVGRDPASIRWAEVAVSVRWDVPGRLVRLSATHDALHGSVGTGEVLLVVADGADAVSRRVRAAHLALVRSLGVGHAPLRVAVAAPATGEVHRIPVDRSLLELAVDRTVEHVALVADRGNAPAVPGRWCRHCHLLDLCDPGLEQCAAATIGASPQH